ncbi:MAG: hypothetical protein ACREXW_09370 [Gammaproteobacteria bacterium]
MKTPKRHRKSLAVALGFVFSMGVAADGPKPVAYVSNQEGGLTVIDLERMEKVREIDVGGRGKAGPGIGPVWRAEDATRIPERSRFFHNL